MKLLALYKLSPPVSYKKDIAIPFYPTRAPITDHKVIYIMTYCGEVNIQYKDKQNPKT
jgi:hypothetical protein